MGEDVSPGYVYGCLRFLHHFFDDEGDVDADDVSLVQDVLGARDAVTDDLVGRRAEALRIAVIVQGTRVRTTLDVELVAVLVDFLGGDTRSQEFPRQTQDLGGDLRTTEVGDRIAAAVGQVPVAG